MLTNLVLLTGVLVAIAVVVAVLLSFRREDLTGEELADSLASGLNQPASLHPVIDLEACLGSGACVDACPESVLGRVGGVTHLIQGSSCLGHGRCKDSCPVGAIALVFGTAERGVDLPLLRAGYETNVDGVMIAGELGGMGLIRNAMSQGRKAAAHAASVLERPGLAPRREGAVDVVIVGGGPAGIAAALECTERGLSFTLLEQFSMGGSVTHYPRRKLIFTERIELPIVGPFGKSEMLKEELVAELERICLAAGIEIQEGRRVTAVDGRAGDLRVQAEREGGREEHRGRTIILAIGRRGTPRRLEVPGEDLPHVVYRMIDAEQYRHRRVLCVGGGDSAVEAAVGLSRVAGTTVHLSYRGKALFRVKKNNREELEAAVASGRVKAHYESQVTRITPERVSLALAGGRRKELEIDDVIVNVGGELPTPFLESIGIQVETRFGEVERPSRRYRGPKPQDAT